MKKTNDLIIVSSFIICICSISAFLLFSPSKEVSETENRPLEVAPQLSLTGVLAGDFSDGVEAYATDQFPARDAWIKSYLRWQIMSGQTFIHDYYLADDWVFPRPFTEVDEAAISFATEQMEELVEYTANEAIELFFFSLPDRRYMIDMSFPKRVQNNVLQRDKNTFLPKLRTVGIRAVDIGEEWQETYETNNFRPYYYRTDHHWNVDGALLAYESIHETLRDESTTFQKDAFDPSAFDKHCLTDKEFLGSYNRQLYGYVDATDEPLCYYLPSEAAIDDWDVYQHEIAEGNELSFSDIFGVAEQKDEKQIAYDELFMSDYDELHILNETGEGKALILKDSYANPLIPLMANNFAQTTIYDVRHNEGRDLRAFIETHDFSTVIFLYSNGRTLDYLYDWTLD
ncbi:MAG TPA: DHHW family protein [Bacillota bacterium]|nr:DHHW family protein [Bacillota bacterium]